MTEKKTTELEDKSTELSNPKYSEQKHFKNKEIVPHGFVVQYQNT